MGLAIKCDRCGKLISATPGKPAYSFRRVLKIIDSGVDQYGNVYQSYSENGSFDLCQDCSEELCKVFADISEFGFHQNDIDEEEDC